MLKLAMNDETFIVPHASSFVCKILVALNAYTYVMTLKDPRMIWVPVELFKIKKTQSVIRMHNSWDVLPFASDGQ